MPKINHVVVAMNPRDELSIQFNSLFTLYNVDTL